MDHEAKIRDAVMTYQNIVVDIGIEYKKMSSFVSSFADKFKKERLLLPYHINVIDELYINENAHSRILTKLLQFKDVKGEYEFLKLLLDYIVQIKKKDCFHFIEICKPEITQEQERIDLWIRDEKFALIFENKIYNAQDQEAQISRYIEKTLRKGYLQENVFVVYLSQDGFEPNNQSWGDYKNHFSDRYVNLSFKEDILFWLKQIILPTIRYKDQYLLNAVSQYIDYLEGFFGLRTINKQLNMDLQKIISDNFELQNCKDDKERYNLLQGKIEDFNEVIKQMRQMKDDYYQALKKTYVDIWTTEVKRDYPQASLCVPQSKECFGLGVVKEHNGKVIQLYIGYLNGQLYCQAQIDDSLPYEERLIDNTPLLGLQDLLTNKDKVCIWKYYNPLDFEGVFDCFIKAWERILLF